MSTDSVEGNLPREPSWEQIDQLLAAVAELARSKIPAETFTRQVLTRVLEKLSGSAAGFWEIDTDGQIALTALIRLEGTDCPEALLDHAHRLKVVRGTVQAKKAIVVEIPLAETASPASVTGPIDHRDCGALLVCPVLLGDECIGILEFIQAEQQFAADRQWSLDVLGSVAELFADHCRQSRLSWLTEREVLWRRLRLFALEIHRTLDLKAIAYAVVNDGRPLINCDRLTLLSCDERRCRVLAVSGAAICDPRSDTVKLLEQLAIAISARRSPFVYSTIPLGKSDKRPDRKRSSDNSVPIDRGSVPSSTDRFADRESLPPAVRDPLIAYLDASGAKSVAVVPLFPEDANEGDLAANSAAAAAVLVAEQFSGGIDSSIYERMQLVAEHCASALKNAQSFKNAPWIGLFGEERWRRLTRGRARLRLSLSVAAAVFVLSWIIPASFEIEAGGELQPRIQRDVFATDDAVVDELKVDHDDRVEAGQVLAILRNPQLDLEFKRVSGELQSTRENLAAVQAARVELAVESAGRAAGAARLSGEEASLKALLASFERQLGLLDEQQAALVVRSPIAGRVLTWDLPQLLQSRPVQRGQVLMKVADPEGPWILELHVPERRIGHLLGARQGAGTPQAVTYILATDPARKHRAQVDTVAASVEPGNDQEPSVLVTAVVNRGELDNPRPGAGATGRVYCGLRPVAYVWLHDLIDAMWAWIRF